MLRIWDTKAPDPSALWHLVKTPDSYGFSRDAKAANLRKATAPDPHSKTPRETPLVDRDMCRIKPFDGLGIRIPEIFSR